MRSPLFVALANAKRRHMQLSPFHGTLRAYEPVRPWRTDGAPQNLFALHAEFRRPAQPVGSWRRSAPAHSAHLPDRTTDCSLRESFAAEQGRETEMNLARRERANLR